MYRIGEASPKCQLRCDGRGEHAACAMGRASGNSRDTDPRCAFVPHKAVLCEAEMSAFDEDGAVEALSECPCCLLHALTARDLLSQELLCLRHVWRHDRSQAEEREERILCTLLEK